MRTLVPLVLAAAACKGKAEPPAPPAPAPKQVPAPIVADAAPHVAKPPPTKEQLAAYKQHMKAGWALQKQQKWADSVPEFEAALAAIDVDQRALSELGWSAMNAGDFVKARKADDQAVRVAIDPKVKASALYNLGLVMAKTSDADGARRAFEASLALRPNKTVEQELAKLGKPQAADEPDCAPGQDPCACVTHDLIGGVADDKPKCELQSDGRLPAGWKLAAVDYSPWSYEFVVDDRGQIAIEVGRGIDRMRLYEDMNLDQVQLVTIGGHQVLKLTPLDRVTETAPRDDDAMDVDEGNTTAATACIVGDAQTPTRCPLRDVPLSITHDRYVLATGGDKDRKSTETTVDLAIAPDGTATVKLVKGASDSHLDALVGPHKLW